MDTKKQKILITGVAGFIGSNLADRLVASGYAVVGIDNLAYGVREQVPRGIEFHKADIRSQEIYPLFQGVDIVFHLAAKNDLLACQANPVETIDVNIRGTANVFEAAKRAGAKKVVYASSSAVEEGEARLRGFYALSKAGSERIAESYREGFGLASVCLRYFNVYGPRQDYRRAHPPVMSALIIQMLKREKPIFVEGSEKNKRDFVYVDDINDFHLLCIADGRVNDKLFRLGSGRSYSIKEVYEVIKKILGNNEEPIVKPRLPGDVPVVTLADIRDAESIGWSPKTSLEEGLRKQVEYLKKEYADGNIK